MHKGDCDDTMVGQCFSSGALAVSRERFGPKNAVSTVTWLLHDSFPQVVFGCEPVPAASGEYTPRVCPPIIPLLLSAL